MDTLIKVNPLEIVRTRKRDVENPRIYISNEYEVLIQNMYKYFMIQPIVKAEDYQSSGKIIMEYQPISHGIMHYYPLLFYLRKNLIRKKILCMDPYAVTMTEALLLLERLQKINYQILAYTVLKPSHTQKEIYKNLTYKYIDKLKGMYKKFHAEYVVDFENQWQNMESFPCPLSDAGQGNSDTCSLPNAPFDVILFKLSKSVINEPYDFVTHQLNKVMQNISINGTLVIWFSYISIDFDFVSNIICSLSQVFDEIHYYRDEIYIISFAIIFERYNGIKVNVVHEQSEYTTCDLDLILQDIEKRQVDTRNKTYEEAVDAIVYQNINNVAFINDNIKACQILEIPVKQSVLDDALDLENAHLRYIKHIPQTTIKSINGKHIQLNKPSGNQGTVNKVINKWKTELNNYGFFIETRDVKKWRSITLKTNMPLYIKKYIRQTYDHPNVSRAFIKLYEILAVFPDFVKNPCHSLHICEAPGEFIAATFHYVYAHHGIMKWNANSLNHRSVKARQKYGYVFGDFFSYMKNYPNNWLYGADNTGDITEPENIKNISDTAKNKLGFINLYTSDCGLNPSEEFEEQETFMSKINLAQVILCLKSLSNGGNAVFKMYMPLAEPITRSILLLLYNNFRKLSIVKQIAGSPGSSEVYLVCEGYDPYEIDFEYLIERLKHFNPKLDLYDNYPNEFNDFIEDAVTTFVQKQLMIIKRNFYYYENNDIFKKHLPYMEEYQKKLAKHWCELVGFKDIPERL